MIKRHIPNLLTITNLLLGFFAILLADLYTSSILICCALLFDLFDGMMARMLNVQSEIGKQLDSLADMVSFGIAPAYLYFTLNDQQSIGYMLPSGVYAVCAGLRLAKFNILPGSSYFIGLPSPTGAIFMIGIFLTHHFDNEYVEHLFDIPYLYSSVPIFIGFLMISNIRMFSIKSMERGVWKNRFHIATLLIFIVLIMTKTKLALSLSVIAYVILSLMQTIVLKRKTKGF